MNKVYEWETMTDQRRRPHVSIYLTDAEIAKLTFIVKNTPFTKSNFCLQAVLPEIDKKVEELKKLGF